MARTGGASGQPSRLNFSYRPYAYTVPAIFLGPLNIPEIGVAALGITSTVATARDDHPVSAVCSIGIISRTNTLKSVPEKATASIGTIPRVNHGRGSGSGVVSLVASYATTFLSPTPTQTVSPTVVAGDYLVIIATQVDNSQVMGTPSGGGLTYTLQESVSGINFNNGVYMWTAPVGTGSSFTCSLTSAGSVDWGFAVYRFSGVTSLGGKNKGNNTTSSAPSISVTTTGTNSAVVLVFADFDGSATAATYLTSGVGSFSEQTHVVDTSVGTTWGGWYPNVGAAGAKTVGMSAPNQRWAMAAIELVPGIGGDNRAQIATAVVGAVGLASVKKTALPALRSVVGLSAYRTIQTAAESGRALLGVTALVTPVKNAIVSVRAAVGITSRITETKTVATAAAGTVGAIGRATESRTAAVVATASAGIIARVAGLARTTPVIAVAYGGVTARAIVVKAAPTTLRTAAGVTSLSTPRKVAIVTDSAPIGLVALRSSAPSAIESGRGVIGLTVTVLTVKRSPVSVAASVSVLGTARAAKFSAQHALSLIGATATARPVQLAVVAAYSSLGAIGRVLDAKSAPTTLRPAVGMVALGNPRKTASVRVSAVAGVVAYTTVRKTVTVAARATAGLVPWVTPGKAVALRGVAVLGIAGTRIFILPGWPPRPMAIALTRAMAAGTVYLTTPSTAAQTELTTTAAAGTTELTEPAHADTEVTRPAAADTEITH